MLDFVFKNGKLIAMISVVAVAVSSMFSLFGYFFSDIEEIFRFAFSNIASLLHSSTWILLISYFSFKIDLFLIQSVQTFLKNN